MDSGGRRSSRWVLKTSRPRKIMPRKKVKYGKRSAYCNSQRLYIDTCLRQDVFHGWLALPLQNPKKCKKSRNESSPQLSRSKEGKSLLFLGALKWRLMRDNVWHRYIVAKTPPFDGFPTSFKAFETTAATKGHTTSCNLGRDWDPDLLFLALLHLGKMQSEAPKKNRILSPDEPHNAWEGRE